MNIFKIASLLSLALITTTSLGRSHCVHHNYNCPRSAHTHHIRYETEGETMKNVKYIRVEPGHECLCDKTRCALHNAKENVAQVYQTTKEGAQQAYQATKEKTNEAIATTKNTATKVGHFTKEAATNLGHTIKETAYKVGHDLKEGATEAKHDIERAKKHSSRTL